MPKTPTADKRQNDILRRPLPSHAETDLMMSWLGLSSDPTDALKGLEYLDDKLQVMTVFAKCLSENVAEAIRDLAEIRQVLEAEAGR